MTDEARAALAATLLDQGLPDNEGVLSLYALVVARSSLVVPMIERKIEEVLKSPDPAAHFGNKTADLQLVSYLAATLAAAGDLEALRQAGKLLKLDEARFDRLVGRVLDSAIARDGDVSSLKLAYEGLELGDPAMEKRIVAWANEVLEQPEMKNVGNGVLDTHGGERREWAKVLVDRYDDTPTEAQWRSDPLVRRLNPELTRGLHDSVIRYAVEAATSRRRK